MERLTITVEEYTNFITDFSKGKFGCQRVGQAFWNKFYGGSQYWMAFDPLDLFYESDTKVAFEKIVKHLEEV